MEAKSEIVPQGDGFLAAGMMETMQQMDRLGIGRKSVRKR